MVGPYPEKKFRPFLDEVNSTFDFEKVEYIESQKLSKGMGVCGALLSLLEGNPKSVSQTNIDIMVTEGDPDLVLFMNHDICCSFPLTDMINDHLK